MTNSPTIEHAPNAVGATRAATAYRRSRRTARHTEHATTETTTNGQRVENWHGAESSVVSFEF
jgi:hypothetical protein